MQTEIASLRQRITELEAEKAELKAELEAKNSEIPELKKKLAEVEARNVKIEARNAELMKQMIEENNRRDVRIEDTNDRVAKLEQKQLQNDGTPNNNLSNFNSGEDYHEKPLEDRRMDDFLNEVNKKSTGEVIRRHNKEKKLQRESANQDSSSDTAYVSGTVDNIEKTDVPKSSNCTSSKLSSSGHETDITNSAVYSNTINDQSASEEIGKTVSLGYDRSASENSEGIRKTVSLGYDQAASGSLKEIDKADYQDKSVVGPSIVTEFVQGLLEELLSSENQLLKDVKFSSPKTIVPGSISIKRLANSFCQANGISDEYLRVRTSRARKINKLFGFEYDPVTLKKIDGIPGYMVNRVTCSADRISKLTNPQIEYIIEQVKSKTIADQSHVNEISGTMANTSANGFNSGDPKGNNSSDIVNVSDGDKVTDYNSDDDFDRMIMKAFERGETRINKDNTTLSIVETEAKANDDDSDSDDSEEEMLDDSDDDEYNGYGGYNEYGERDRGYYYRDGRYERKGSPVMSPIISPVTV
ncbi:hypothetical protein RhiirA5_506933 [Rhizophagus irregularis]|uniref:Uncharacterized protein n=1 Tax=Rhizophagus irregularis TaxID=588596 RepID=A0A2N0NPL4_9GLOM|nr:hypothetical protein RhiirA5_506933 [Rhizophagus irregularis]